MTELDIEITSGRIRPIPAAGLTSSQVLLSGPGELFGWSFRESGSETGFEAENSAVAPGAGGTIVQILNVPAGVYNVSWEVELIGAAAAGDASNFVLKVGATSIVVSINPGAAGQYPQEPFQLTVNALSTVSIQAIAAGTAGVTYGAQITLVPAITGQAVLELQDGNNVLGEIVSSTAGNLSTWFGPQGVRFYNQIKAVPINGVMVGAIYAKYGRAHGYT